MISTMIYAFISTVKGDCDKTYYHLLRIPLCQAATVVRTTGIDIIIFILQMKAPILRELKR